jgi:hypothetical protein
LQSLKKLYVDIVFVDEFLVPLQRHGIRSPKKTRAHRPQSEGESG